MFKRHTSILSQHARHAHAISFNQFYANINQRYDNSSAVA